MEKVNVKSVFRFFMRSVVKTCVKFGTYAERYKIIDNFRQERYNIFSCLIN